MPERTEFIGPGVAAIASDGAVRQERLIPAPTKGLMEGLDAAALNYPDNAAPVLTNIRVSRQTWLTRLGEALQYTGPNTNVPRFLDFLFQSNGTFTWLMASGAGATAQLYEIILGTNTGWVAATGGGSLGGTAQPYFQGTTLADKFYFTDRQNVPFKYSPTGSPNHVLQLTLPAKPASPLTAVPRPFGLLENYNTAWSASNAGNFNQSTDATNPPPDGSVSSHLNAVNSGALGNNVSSTDFIFPVQHGTYVGGISHSLAFWVKQDQNAVTQSVRMQIQYGTNTATDYSVSMYSDSENVNVWYPLFVQIGDLAALNFLRVFVQNAKGGGSNWMSDIYLPGTLEGPYRWVYTYVDSTGNRESPPSDITNNGQPLDFSLVGKSFDQNTAGAFSKSCLLIPTISGDSSVNTIRIYRNGGVPSLTVDGNGLPLWLFVDSVPNFSTTINQVGGTAVGDLTVVLSSVTGLAVGNWLVFEPGQNGKQEALQITIINSGAKSVTLTGGLNLGNSGGRPDGFAFTHANTAAVRACYVDNTPNEAIQTVNTLDIPLISGESTRSAPPAAPLYLQKSPEGRLWEFGYSGHPNGIAVSNLATPFRPVDYETFTVGVDPLTRNSPTMGWNFDLFKDVAQDEAIQWGGFFQGWPVVLTRNNLYRITAHSQQEWGPTSIQRIVSVGCLPGAGDTVREVDDWLYWVAPGPKVMRWDGRSEPQDISWLRCNVRLKAAPVSKWGQWFATTHRRQEGRYYCLYFASAAAGANGCDQRLDYNIDLDAWEPCVYAMASGTQSFSGAFATDVPGSSIDGLYQIDTTSNTYLAETGNLDGANPIAIAFSTPQFPLFILHQVWFRWVDETLLQSLDLRLPAVNDSISLKVSTDHGEYLPVSHTYTLNLLGNETGIQNAPPAATVGNFVEIKQRLDRDLIGRAAQINISGNVSNRPEFNLLRLMHVPLRHGRVST